MRLLGIEWSQAGVPAGPRGRHSRPSCQKRHLSRVGSLCPRHLSMISDHSLLVLPWS